jgi:hypothetical protein
MYALGRIRIIEGRAAAGRNGGHGRRLAIEPIEQRWMLSATLGVDQNHIAYLPDLAPHFDPPAEVSQGDSQSDAGMLENLWSSSFFGVAQPMGGVDAANRFNAFSGAALAAPADMPPETPPPAARILADVPAFPVPTFAGAAKCEPEAQHSKQAPPAGGSGQRFLPIGEDEARAALRRDTSGMIDITPRPGQPEVILARDEPPPVGDPPAWVAISAPQSAEIPARAPLAPEHEPDTVAPDIHPSKVRAVRFEGAQGRSQAFDLAVREHLTPLRWAFADRDTAPSGAVIATTAATVEQPPQTPAAMAIPASAKPVEPPATLPDDANESIDAAATQDARSAKAKVSAVQAASAAAHDQALADVFHWVDDNLPRLAMSDVRRAQEAIPLIVLATVSQHFYQGNLPDACGPTTLVPPRRKAR